MKNSTKALFLAVLIGIALSPTPAVYGQTFPTPYTQNFEYPFPQYMGANYDGWETIEGNPDWTNCIAYAGLYPYDGRAMIMRNRMTDSGTAGVGVRLTNFLISPGITIFDADAIITWVEAALTSVPGYTWDGPRNSPLNLLISVDGGEWTLVDSYSSGVLPNASIGEGYRRMTYPLGTHIGKTIRWKWEQMSIYQPDAVNPNKWEYTYWAIDNVFIGSGSEPIPSIGPGFFPVSFGQPGEAEFGLTNSGPELLHLTSITTEGDPDFTISVQPSSYPVDISGFINNTSPIYNIWFKVKFLPTTSGVHTGTVVIGYNGTTKSIPVSATAFVPDCTSAIPITDLMCSEGPPAECKKSILGPQNAFYSYTALYDQDVTISSCDPHNDAGYNAVYAWDTWLVVYPACPFDPITALIVNNDDQEGRCGYNRAASAGTFHMTTNQTVYIYWPMVFPEAANSSEDFVFSITVTPTPPWPDAEFYADQTVIEAGGSVNFTCNSTGSPTTWAWEFPGSTQATSAVENPTGITYPTAGNYQVILTASNTNFSGNMTKMAYIVVGAAAAEDVPGGAEGFDAGGLKSASVTTTTDWIFGDNNGYGMNWQIRNTGVVGCTINEGTMQSTTGSTGYLVMPAVEYNCAWSPPRTIDIDAFAQSPSFDCSGYDIVIYQFQQRFNADGQQPRMELQVSKDGGYNWKAFDVLQGRSLNTTWGNPVDTVQINITEAAGRQPDVRVRFYWKGSTGNFWMIDDVEVLGIKACEGLSVTITKDRDDDRNFLKSKVTGGLSPYTYLWSNGETSSRITVSPWRTTDYQLDVTDVQGCTTSSTVTVTGRACKDFSVSISGEDKVYLGYAPKSSTTLKSRIREGRSPFTYLWSTGATTPNITASPAATTRYELEVTDYWGCKAVARFTVIVEDVRCGTNLDQVLLCKQERNRKSVTVCVPSSQVASLLRSGASLGPCRKSGLADDGVVSEIAEPEMLIFPNPNNGRVNLELKGLNGEQVSIEVRDVLGKVVYREEVDAPEELLIKVINLDRSGIYFISVKNSSVSLTSQVAVIK